METYWGWWGECVSERERDTKDNANPTTTTMPPTKPSRPRVVLDFEVHDDLAGWRDTAYRVKCLLKRAWRDMGFRATGYRWTGDGCTKAMPPLLWSDSPPADSSAAIDVTAITGTAAQTDATGSPDGSDAADGQETG